MILFTVPQAVPDDLIWIPGEEYTYDTKEIPISPYTFMYHILCLFIDKEVQKNKDLKRVPFTSQAHPYTAWIESVISMFPNLNSAHEAINGAIGCALGVAGQDEVHVTAGSDGHGKEKAPYTSAATFMYAEKNRKSILEAFRKRNTVGACLRKPNFADNLFVSFNPKIAQKFENDFGVDVKLGMELVQYIPLQPVYTLEYLKAKRSGLI